MSNALRSTLAGSLLFALPSCLIVVVDPPRERCEETCPAPAAAEVARERPSTVASPEAPSQGIDGVVVDSGGARVPARVALVQPGGSTSWGTDGRFSFPHVAPGRYACVASTEDGRIAAPVVVDVGGEVEPVRLVLEAGAFVDLSIPEGGENARCAIEHGGERVADWTIRPGKSERVVVPAGRSRLEVYRGGDVLLATEVQVSAGDVLPVAVDLRR